MFHAAATLRRFRRKGYRLVPVTATLARQAIFRRAPQECRARPGPLQWPVVTHNRASLAPQEYGPVVAAFHEGLHESGYAGDRMSTRGVCEAPPWPCVAQC
jgi:hypothetical protein